MVFDIYDILFVNSMVISRADKLIAFGFQAPILYLLGSRYAIPKLHFVNFQLRILFL